jgi:PAS domain S-box-containing protein
MVLNKEITLQIKDLLQKNPQGLSITDIVKEININRNTAGRYLENLLISGQVELRRFGMAKIYRISQRVPLSAVLSISSELVVQLDSFLRIIFVNESFCTLAGTDSKNLIGKNIEYTPVALAFDELFVGFIERIREGVAGIEWSGEIELTSKGIIVFCRIAPTVFEDGRKGVSIILEDITQRKQGEWALLESEATARALMSSPTDTVILMDTRGIILDLNETAAFKFKKYGDNLIGTLADTLLPHEVAQSRRTLTNRVIEKKQMVRYEDERDGRWYDTVAYPIIVNGEVTRIAMIARDITDRKKSEDALRESEEHYRQLVDISPDAVLIHIEGKITYLNQAALFMLGAKNSHEILGKNVLDLIHPDFRDTVRKNIEKDLNGETTAPTELEMLRVNGTTIVAEGRGVKTTFNSKPAIQVAIRDTTERKRIETELRESEGRLRLLLDSTDDLIFMQDPEGRYLYFNATDRYGVSRKNMLGLTPYEIVDKVTANRIVERVRKVIKTGLSIREENQFIWKGQTLWFSDRLSPVKDKNGTNIAVVTISHNITESKLAEIALRESEVKYRTLVNRANDVICVIQEGIIKMCNPRLPEFWGGSGDEIVGRPFTDFVHPDALSKLIDIYKRRISGESPPSIYETTLLHKDGSKSFVEVNAGVIVYEGRPADLVIVRDINDRKKAEVALRESEATARALMNAPTDSVILTDSQGVILELNETAASRFGRRPEELVGVLAADLLPKEVAHSRSLLMSQIIEEKTMVRFEDQRDGTWYDTVAYPIISETGEVIRIAIIARDITDRKNTEKHSSRAKNDTANS